MNDLVYGGIVKFAMSLTRAVVKRRLAAMRTTPC
jgi:hypothetical protein